MTANNDDLVKTKKPPAEKESGWAECVVKWAEMMLTLSGFGFFICINAEVIVPLKYRAISYKRPRETNKMTMRRKKAME